MFHCVYVINLKHNNDPNIVKNALKNKRVSVKGARCQFVGPASTIVYFGCKYYARKAAAQYPVDKKSSTIQIFLLFEYPDCNQEEVVKTDYTTKSF